MRRQCVACTAFDARHWGFEYGLLCPKIEYFMHIEHWALNMNLPSPFKVAAKFEMFALFRTLSSVMFFLFFFFSVSQQRRYVVWKWWNLFGAILSKPNEHTIELTEKESSRSLCMNFIPLERVFIGNYTMHEWNDYEVYYCRLNDLAAWRSPPTIAMLSLT